jgi:hypothetical protein
VPPGAEDQSQSQGTDGPRSSGSQIAREVEVKQTARHDGQAAEGGGGGEEAFRPQHQEHEAAEAQADECRQKADPAYLGIGDDRDGRDAQDHGQNETVALADQLAFLFLEGPQLARVVYRVADIAQRPEQFLGAHHLRVVLDERLFVGEAHRDLIAGQAAERLLDRARAQRAVKSADARTDFPPVRARRRFLVP